MKKNEMGKVLKVFGIIVIVLGVISSLILGFSARYGRGMNEIMGYVMEPTITYNFSKAVFGIFASVISGLILMGLSEIITILDEKRENSRRLCIRFGIKPVESNFYMRRNSVNPNYNMPRNQNMAPNQNMPGNQNMKSNQNTSENQNVASNQNMSENQNVASNQNMPENQNVASNQNMPENPNMVSNENAQKEIPSDNLDATSNIEMNTENLNIENANVSSHRVKENW